MEELTKVRMEIADHPMWLQLRENLKRHREEILHLHDLLDGNEVELTRFKEMISQTNNVVPLELRNVVVAAFLLLAIIIYLSK